MNQKLDTLEYLSLALPPNTELEFHPDLVRLGYLNIKIRNVKEIYSSYIVYNAACHYANMNEAEELLVYEDFHVLKDKRGNDGLQRIIENEMKDDGYSHGFIDFILKCDYEGQPWMIRQICECYGDEYGLNPSYLLANGTRYFIPSIKPRKLMNSTTSHSRKQSYNSYSDLHKPSCRVNDVNKTALICPKCGFPCSTNSPKCPNCGEQLYDYQRSINREIVTRNLKYIISVPLKLGRVKY